jgi:hypothetical protein
MSSAISSTSTSDGSWGVVSPGSSQLLYPPEPGNSAGTWLRAAGTAISTVGSGVADLVKGVVEPNQFESLLGLQMQLQREMQVYSMWTNISRTKHETDMTAIRNMRLG